ncbi:WD repeat-containing protein wrap73 [Kickxella alabastrina]|uniref:WD repeat-containing protein wrap73 n=1 Tax=Kickxella alabastrina TaxID=61397 RepID=A0ACC1IP95_9FUNG|nr:WD repeat-containing protein wrap73 [Kickxella alabastrina]
MEFTELYKQSNSALVSYSPDGAFIAVSVEHRLIVRDAQNPKRVHRVCVTPYDTAPYIEDIQWSPSSTHLLTCSYTHNRVDVWSLSDDKWQCTITDEVCCIERALWTPDSRHILTFSELDLRLSIWSISATAAGEARRYVQFPKTPLVAFHPLGSYMAVAQRREYRDVVGIYATADWHLVCEIEPRTMDMVGLRWSPDGLHLAAWDSAATYAVSIMNVCGMFKRVHTRPEGVEGLGVREVAWAPSAQFLAVGGYDRVVRVLNHLTWSPIATLVHRAVVQGPVDVFSEVVVGQTLAQSSQAALAQQPHLHRRHTRFDLMPTPAQIHVVQPLDIHRAVDPPASDSASVGPGSSGNGGGISILEFNADGTLLVSVCDGMPNSLWIWRIRDMRLVAVIQTRGVLRACRWSPVESVLGFVTGSASVYLWREGEGCHLFEVPVTAAGVGVGAMTWNPCGDSMATMSKGLFSLAYLTSAAAEAAAKSSFNGGTAGGEDDLE